MLDDVPISILLLILVLIVTGSIPVQAVSAHASQVPQSVSEGDFLSVTFTVENLFLNPSVTSWNLITSSDLTDPTWIFESYNQAGGRIERKREITTGASMHVNLSSNVAYIEVHLSGNVPPKDEPMDNTILIAGLSHSYDSEINSWQVPYSDSASSTRTDLQSKSETPQGSKSTEPSESANSMIDSNDEQNINRGFFTNNPQTNSPMASLNSSQITTIGFILSIIGILLELRSGG